MPNDLRVGIVADASSLEAAMSGADSAVQKFVGDSATAFARFNAAANSSKAAADFLTDSLDAAMAAGYKGHDAMNQAVAAYDAMTAATVADTAAVTENTVARAANTAGMRYNVEAYGSARIAIAGASGSVNGLGYALASVAGRSKVLAPILQSAFPVLGALAMVAVAVDLGGELVKLADNASSLADELNVSWLTGAIGQMDGLAAAAKQADDEMSKLATDADQLNSQKQAADIAHVRLTQGAPAAYRAEAASKQDEIRKNNGLLSALLEDQAGLEKRASAKRAAYIDPYTGTATGSVSTTDALKARLQLKVVNEQIAQTRQTNAVLQEQAQNLNLQAQQAQDKAVGHARAHSSAIPGFAGMEGRFRGTAPLPGTEMSRQLQERLKMQDRRVSAAARQDARMVEQGNRVAAAIQKQADEDHLKAVRAANKASIAAADSGYSQTSQNTAYAQQTGQIGSGQRLQILLSASRQREQIEVQAQKNIMATYAKGSAQYLQEQNKLTAIERQATMQREQLVNQDALRRRQIATSMFSNIDQQFNQTVDVWLQGSQRMGYAWTKMADGLAITMTNALIKIAAQELVSLATHKAIGEQERLDDAKSAAVSSFKWASSWGGPVAGAIAAAVAFAAAASYDTGTDYVPKTGMALIHKGERILNVQQNEQITKAMAGGGPQSGNHFHYSPHVSAIDGPSVAGMMRQHSNIAERQFYRQQRLAGRVQ